MIGLLTSDGQGNAPREVAYAFHRTLPVELAPVDLRRRDRAVSRQLLQRLDVAGVELEVEDGECGSRMSGARRPRSQGTSRARLGRQSGDPGDPGDFLDVYASREVYNASHLNDPRVDSLLASAARKSGLARAVAYARVDRVLVRDAAPAIAFANESTHDFFSARIGCQLEAAGGGIDLGALCIRAGRGAAGPQALRPINPLPNREGSAP